jgi:DNA-directed RNA polymerase subunit K/omega
MPPPETLRERQDRAERLAREERLAKGEGERAKFLAALDRPEDDRAGRIASNLGISQSEAEAVAAGSSFGMAPVPQEAEEPFYAKMENFGFPERWTDVDKAPEARTKSKYADTIAQLALQPGFLPAATPASQMAVLGDVQRNLAIDQAVRANPDEEAKIRDLAGKLQMPPAMVRAIGVTEATNQLTKRQAQQTLTMSPALVKAFSRPDFVSLAADDLKSLSGVERTLRETFGGGEVSANQAKISELDYKRLEGKSLLPTEIMEYQRLKSRNSILQQQLQSTENGVTWTTNTVASGVTDIALGVPEMATYGFVGALFGMPVVGVAAGQISYNFRQIAGNSFGEYSDFRDDTGKLIDEDAARGAAYINAVLSVGLEVAGERAQLKNIPGIDKLVGGKDVVKGLLQTQAGRNIMLRVGKKVATGAIMEGVTEGLQEISQIAIGETLKIVAPGEFAPITAQEALARTGEAAAAGAVVGGAIVGAAAPVQVLIENRELRKADIELTTSEGTVNRIEAAIAATAETKLVARDRGELERFIDEAAADSPVSTIYLSAEDLASVATTAGLEPRQLAQQLGVADQIQTSATTGSLLEMPIGKFIATVAGTDLAAPLTQVIKTNPFLLNRIEQEAFASSGRADIIAEADRLVQEALTDETFAAEAQSIQSEVLQQFRAIEGGEVFTPEVSRAYSTITTQTYVSLARRLGISPREAYERYQRGPLKIERQAGPVEGVGQPVMEQAQTEGYTGQDIGEAQEWVRARAKGLDMSQPARMARAQEAGFDTETVLYHGTTKDFDKFIPGASDNNYGAGVYVTESTNLAAEYARGTGARILPLLIKKGKYANEDVWDKAVNRAQAKLDKTEPDAPWSRWHELATADLKKRGFLGVIGDNQAVVFDPANIRSVNAAFDPDFAESANVLAQDELPTQQSSVQPDGDSPMRVSTRQPWAVKSQENALTDNLIVGLDSTMADPKFADKVAAMVRGYVNFPPVENETTEQTLERYIQHVVDNLLWLHDSYDAETRDRADEWYNGARAITDAWMVRYDLPDIVIAGVIAALSPQKDWFQNVSMAERVLDIYKTQRETIWSPEMQATADRIFPRIKLDPKTGEPVVNKKGEVQGYEEIRNAIDGKTIADLEAEFGEDADGFVAAWIRIYDQTYNEPGFRVITPEGRFGEYVVNQDGVSRSRVQWGSLTEIAKAVSMIRNPTRNAASVALGAQHKVRNFYNNILAPDAPHGDVTIDTHAVAAAHIRPHSAASPEVDQNLNGPPTSAATGTIGTYGIHAEAYRRAAQQRNILPRQMQSITWEAVRTLFKPRFKTKTNAAKVDAIWKEHRDGAITAEQARNRVSELAGGIEPPAWVGTRPDIGDDAASGYSTYEGEVPRDRLSGRPAEGMGGGIGSAAAAGDTENLGQDVLAQSKRNLDALGFYSAVQEAALRVPDGIWQLGWNAARNAIAKGRGGVPPRRTEMEYLGLDAMFGDTKIRPGDNFPRKGPALKEAVLEHIAAKRLSLVEIFTRFDPTDKKIPSKRAMLEAMSPQALSSLINVDFQNSGNGRGEIVSDLGNPLYLYIQRKGEPLASPTYYDLMQPQAGGEAKVIATGTTGDLDPIVGKMIFDANPERAARRIDKDVLAEAYREGYASNLVRGPGDIRLPGEGVPLFEAVIGFPKGVPGADYQAPISHVGGKAKGTLVTAHGEERIDDKGQRTIFVGQVQSDMAQQVRELRVWQDEQKRSLELIIQRSGIVDRETAAAFMKADGATDAGIAEFSDADLIGFARQRWSIINGGYRYNYGNLRRLDNNPSQTLDAPLLSTSEWTNVAVRAMIYRAARGGFQSISFPTGETSEIIQGNNYAAQHYETNVKGALEKIGKQLGGEVRKGDVRYQDDEWAVFEDDVPFANTFNSAESAEGFAAERREYDSRSDVEVRNIGVASAYILDITPEMREKILSEGFPLFQERRGEYVPNLNTIRLLPKADWSSYLHEMGHHFLEVYNTAALQIEKMPEADRTPDEQKIVDDMRILLTDMARQANVPIVGDVLQWWANTPLAGRTPVHEKYAEATEKYFMEGKAPVPELQALFDRFKQWLIKVYENLTALKVELTPEVRGVMDRMYAAHETVRTAEYNRKLVALFREKPEAMTDQEWTAYQQIAAQATSDAQDDLTARSLRDMQWASGAKARVLRDMQRDNADKRKLVRAEVAAEVMAKPVNVVRSFLRRGIAPNGEPVTGPHKLNIDLLKARYPDVSGVDWKRLGYGQYGMLAKDGLDPDMAAEMLGYPSGEAMVRDLLAAGPAEPEIDAETDRRMLERFGDLTDEVKMSKAADEVIHSAMRAKVLQAEYAALIKASKQTKPLVIAAKEIAREIVGRQLASKLNLNKYLAAERAAGRKAEAAMRSGDFVAAASAKRDQLLNFEVVREAQRVLKERDKALDLFNRINKAKRETVAKTRNYDLVQAARAVLAAYGFGSVKNQPMDYMSAVKAYDPALYSALEPTIIAAVTAGKTLDQLTVTEFMGLRDTVRQFWDLSRQEMKVDIEGRQLDLEDIVQDLNGQLEAQGAAPKGPSTEAPTEWQKRLRQFAGLKASMRRVETWARLFDRGKAGAFTRFIWRPISEAADRYRADRNKYVIRFRELFRAIEPTMSAGKINAPEINYTFKNKSELLHAILHTGNGSNYRKLLLGRGWGSEDQDGNLIDNAWVNLINRLSQEGVLNKTDFDFAQSVWDLLEEIKPLAQATHKKVFGSYFAEITAEAVQTPFGTYKGGYVPAVYDTYNVQDAALRAQQEAVEANDSTMFPSPASGFTKSRVEYNRELALDLMIMSSHIDKVLKFAHLASPVRDVLKILRNKSFSAMLESVDPTAQSDMLLPWLTRAARQITEEPTKGQGGPMVDGFFRAIRQRSGMGLMFANIVNVAQQVTGFSVAALTVKPKYLASGMIRYIRNPIDLTRTIRQASPMMADRGDNQLASMYGEIDKIIDKDDKYGQARDWFGRHTYFMQQGVQNVMDVIVWAGAYDQALAEGSTETEAARQGDAAVRQTQGSTFAEDVSRIETGPAVLRSFVHMYGYFNMWGNLLSTEMRTAVSELGLKKGAGRLMFVYVAGFAIPALLAQLIADGLRGQLPEDEDDDGWLDEWMSWFFGTQAKTTLAFAPIVGQAGTAAIGAFTSVPYDDRVGGSPAISAIEAAVRTPASVYEAVAEDGDKSRAVKDVLTLMTTLTGLPFQTISRPVGYAVDVAEGDITPTSVEDYIRGLVTGSASQASR